MLNVRDYTLEARDRRVPYFGVLSFDGATKRDGDGMYQEMSRIRQPKVQELRFAHGQYEVKNFR